MGSKKASKSFVFAYRFHGLTLLPAGVRVDFMFWSYQSYIDESASFHVDTLVC